jgi:lysophospholipase L1-like esterase
MMKLSFRKAACLGVLLGLAASSQPVRADSILKDGDRLAIVGDSITEQKQYSVFIENYLRMCQPKKVDVIQFGWSGEVSWNFVKRMNNDVLPFKPTLVTTCYGMNDGGYRVTDPTFSKMYRNAMTEIVTGFQNAGARVIVGSPGAVDPVTFTRGPAPDVYNRTLADYAQIAKEVAEATGSIYADVHTPLRDVTNKAKAKFGQNYHVTGGDGYHPSANGHLVMAHAFLKAMGVDGQIGSIHVDLGTGTATASEHHTVEKTAGNAFTIKSTRYPFCFGGDPAKPQSTTGVTEFFDFNNDLNRFTLTVTNAAAPRYKITWGNTSRQYTADELQAGINLAADFVDNPFSEPFNVVERAIREKQAWETKMIKGLINSLGSARAQIGNDPAFDATEAVVRREHDKLTQRVNEAVKPVTHTITIEPLP